MAYTYVNIHTHKPTGEGLELQVAGIHPWGAAKEHHTLPTISNRVQAIGEIGLDFAHSIGRQQQEILFRRQLQLAELSQLPVILHCVHAFEPILQILPEYKLLPAVIFHGFIGSEQQAAQAIRRGYFLSFGERTFASPKTCAALRCTPLSQLFLETDDSPITIAEIYAQAAEVKGVTLDELCAEILKNYNCLFR
ncbi:MAG: TatD family hydrolase [Alistipes sp.]